MGKVRGIGSQRQINKNVISAISSICSTVIIILVCMQLLGIWKTAANVFEPLLGVLMLIQVIKNWKKNKVVAIVSLCAAMLIFGFSIFIFFIR